MLSKTMVKVLITPSNRHAGAWQYYRDGRTVRALQARGLIKSVSFKPRLHRGFTISSSNPNGLWRYKYTKSGIQVSRALRLIDRTVRKEIF